MSSTSRISTSKTSKSEISEIVLPPPPLKFSDIMSLDKCPPGLKAVAHYLKIAEDHDTRDVIISYWARLYALEVALQLSKDSKTPEVNKFLLSIMDWLEEMKKAHTGNECITNKVGAQSYIENYSLRLFKYADDMDKTEQYGKNVVKAFYTAGILMDILTSFGALDEDIAEKRKYAKWKAAYIHNCLKVGERPLPGSFENQQNEDFTRVNNESSDIEFNNPADEKLDNLNIPNFPTPPSNVDESKPSFNPVTNFDPLNIPGVSNFNPTIPPVTSNIPSPLVSFDINPPVMPNPVVTPIAPPVTTPVGTNNNESLDPEKIQKAQKYCKWATSALNYDDIKTAIDNLQKALTLLQTGKDSPE